MQCQFSGFQKGCAKIYNDRLQTTGGVALIALEGLEVAKIFARFELHPDIVGRVLSGLGIKSGQFWVSLDKSGIHILLKIYFKIYIILNYQKIYIIHI